MQRQTALAAASDTFTSVLVFTTLFTAAIHKSRSTADSTWSTVNQLEHTLHCSDRHTAGTPA